LVNTYGSDVAYLGYEKEGRPVKAAWDFVIKYEFWFLISIVICLEIGDYLTGERLMGGLASLVFITAIVRLAMHPMWKKTKE
jgi:hypothetical protein